ncbi:hypothetical protein niasHT_007672 [Heterodera trifolii]|uniref:Uncharacterized protein n=1 Tax=Heterodera trifolii TaxID=157864 RepID=A0ABD2LQ46_9BILA
MEFSTEMDDGDGVEQHQSTDGQGLMNTSSDEKQPQITITVMSDGGVKVTDVCGTEYMVDKGSLNKSDIDTKSMSQQDVDKLLSMTIYDQEHRFAIAVENTDNTSQGTVHSTSAAPQGSKNQNKRPRRAATAAQRKRRLEEPHENDEQSSAVDPKAQSSSSILKRFAGATCYKPIQVNHRKKVPNFCCAVCNKTIPKTATDFILLRLPAHAQCAKNTMMVLSDEDGDAE